MALNGALELASVEFDLPESHPGQPEPLTFVDTSAFGALSGITGYRIDRRELGSLAKQLGGRRFPVRPGHHRARAGQRRAAAGRPGHAAGGTPQAAPHRALTSAPGDAACPAPGSSKCGPVRAPG
ncbi:hypothetical protein LP419_14615 [Massilia sp. H-1]|nr:hypothetical protein LP419_14615 [Massilia sp. H-1]